jgi:hypothetical protein
MVRRVYGTVQYTDMYALNVNINKWKYTHCTHYSRLVADTRCRDLVL